MGVVYRNDTGCGTYDMHSHFNISYLIPYYPCAIVQQGLCVWFVAQFVHLSATFWVICMIKVLSRARVAPEILVLHKNQAVDAR